MTSARQTRLVIPHSHGTDSPPKGDIQRRFRRERRILEETRQETRSAMSFPATSSHHPDSRTTTGYTKRSRWETRAKTRAAARRPVLLTGHQECRREARLAILQFLRCKRRWVVQCCEGRTDGRRPSRKMSQRQRRETAPSTIARGVATSGPAECVLPEWSRRSEQALKSAQKNIR